MKKKGIKILLVDDEPDIIEIIRYNLLQEGYQVFSASNGLEAIGVAKKENPHLIILDIMMPEMDGIEACQIIRSNVQFQETVIMFLTARGEDFSLVAGYEAGADDYVTKPIKPKVLLSKVKGLLRRFDKKELIAQHLTFDTLVIDREEYLVFIDGERLSLPKKEFELLYLLASKPEKVFKREYIMETVWGNDVVVGDRTIDVHIRKLREKIGDKFFKTVKGVGYKFKAPE